jgi:hypothetical protein
MLTIRRQMSVTQRLLERPMPEKFTHRAKIDAFHH